MVYLKILPNPSLSVDMNPQSIKISGKSKYFHLQVSNQGNFDREVKFTVDNRDDIFNYSFDSNPVLLSPAEDTELFLKAKPKRWKWRLRCFQARQQEINFDLKLKDDKFLPPEEVLAQGTLIWVSRPWWLFWFLIALGLLSLGAIGIFIWSVFLNRPLPPYPEITEVNNYNNISSYQVGETVFLDWNVKYIDKVKRITFITLNNNNEINRKNYIIKKNENKINTSTEESKEKFNLEFLQNIFKQKKEEYNIESEILSLKGKPCQVINNNDDKELKCSKFPIKVNQSGNYVYKLEVFTSENSKEPIDVNKTDTITVTPHPIPRISSLVTDKPNYQLTKDSEQLPVKLKWEISNPDEVKELNLIALKPDNSVHFQENYNFQKAFDKYTEKDDYFDIEPKSDDKVINNPEQKSEKIVECEKKYAEILTKTRILICNLRFPQGLEPGDYIFKLGVVPKNKLENQKNDVLIAPYFAIFDHTKGVIPSSIPNHLRKGQKPWFKVLLVLLFLLLRSTT